MGIYQATNGDSSFIQQWIAMFCRRFIVFTREPRQWFLTISPFLNVCVSILIIYSFYNTQNSDDKKLMMKIINYMIALIFPYILNIGFATTSGIYMLMPIEERQRKTRHILKISGLQAIPYWLGLFAADYLLFLIPTALFGVVVGISGLQIFSDDLFAFIGGMLGFGIAIITMTYFLASFFS